MGSSEAEDLLKEQVKNYVINCDFCCISHHKLNDSVELEYEE